MTEQAQVGLYGIGSEIFVLFGSSAGKGLPELYTKTILKNTWQGKNKRKDQKHEGLSTHDAQVRGACKRDLFRAWCCSLPC